MSKSKGSNSSSGKPTTQQAASRIYRVASLANGGNIPKGSHAARAQRAAHRNGSGK